MFKEKYTTQDLLKKDPIGEKDKIVISNDAYSTVEILNELCFRISRLKNG